MSDKILDLRMCDFTGKNLSGKVLSGALLKDATLPNAILREVVLTKVRLPRQRVYAASMEPDLEMPTSHITGNDSTFLHCMDCGVHIHNI